MEMNGEQELEGTQEDGLEASPSEETGEVADTAVAEVGVIDPTAMREEVAGGPLLLAAYLALWVVVFVFIFRVRKSTEKMAADVAELETRLEEGLRRAQERGNSTE